MGRHAPTAAAVVVIGGLDVVIGVLCALGFVALGYEPVGSVALAASFTVSGLLFAAFEPILATCTSRWSWASSHLVIAVTGTVVVMAASGLGTGLGHAAAVGDSAEIGRLVWAALVTVPATWVLLGVAVALFGVVPAAAYAAWVALAAAAVIGFLGPVLRLPAWTRQLSPFEHVPAVPAEPTTVVPLVVLAAIAVGLTGVGLWGFRRRDLRTG